MGTIERIIKEMIDRLSTVMPEISGQLISTCKLREVVEARHELIWRIHTAVPSMNQTQIAMRVGLDRSTISYILDLPSCKVGGIPALQRKLARQQVTIARAKRMISPASLPKGERNKWVDVWHARSEEALYEEEQVRKRLLAKQARDAAIIAKLPPDTRSNTARLCGDPLPGRSALDRKSVV